MIKKVSYCCFSSLLTMCLVPPIGLTDDVEEFSDVEDQINDNDLR